MEYMNVVLGTEYDREGQTYKMESPVKDKDFFVHKKFKNIFHRDIGLVR